MTWLALVVDALAVYRLTRLVTADTLTQTGRDWIIRWSYNRWRPSVPTHEDELGSGTLQSMAQSDEWLAPSLAKLITCRWCAGVWVAAGVTAARWCAPVLWGPPAWGLAVSCAAPLLARFED